MLPDVGIFERFFAEKRCSWSHSLPWVSQNRSLLLTRTYPLFYLTGSDGICGVLTDEVEWHLLDSNLLQGQKLDPQVDTHIYELIMLVHR